MVRVRAAGLVAGLLTIAMPAMAQMTEGGGSGIGTPATPRSSVLPPSTQLGPNAAPSPNQQLDIQNERNQLQLRERSDESRGTGAMQDQLSTQQQLNQLNQTPQR
jgi:hypothetical protein